MVESYWPKLGAIKLDLSGNWHIIFCFESGYAEDLDLLDTH